MTVQSAAEDYLIAGISVIPVRSDKTPYGKWETFQTKPVDIAQCDRLFSAAWGVAIIAGPVSGGLEIIDFDAHNKDIDSVFNGFSSDDGVRFIMDRSGIVIERSPRGGYHVMYRYEAKSYDGNMKLASWDTGESMIETRGRGGYVVVYPSPKYTLVAGSIDQIPVITQEERDYLINFCRTFNKFDKPQQAETTSAGFHNTDPVSYFNWNCSSYAKMLLKDTGWTMTDRNDREGIEYWRRPGKPDGEHSATWGKKHNSLYVFSSSAEPFMPECYYTPFQILTMLRFGGAFQAAINWVIHKYFDQDVQYIRVGVDYFKRIHKKDRYGTDRIELKPWTKEEIKQDHGKAILDSIPKFDGFDIVPNNMEHYPVVGNCYNLYSEFPHTPKAGTWRWTEVLLRHIFGEQYNLGIRYMQILYCHPAHIMPILVLVSKERQTGKTTFVNWLNAIFGQNMVNIMPEDLVSGFNSSYASANIIAVEETLIEKAVTVEKIKALATQKQISVNQKFVSHYNIAFYGKIILTSNNEDKFARIDEDEIRFFVRKLSIPKIENHNIELDMVYEIPAFLHYLTTLPPVDFSTDRTGFTPGELINTSLIEVKRESKSWLYKEMFIHIEDLFLNELKAYDEFYADAKNIRDRWFSKDNRAEAAYIRRVLKDEFRLEPSDGTKYFSPFVNDPPKSGRPYTFTRGMFTDEPVSSAEVFPF